MAPQGIREVVIHSKGRFSDAQNDLIVELANDFTWKCKNAEIILHDVWESQTLIELIIEIPEHLMADLLSSIQDTFSEFVLVEGIQ